MAAVVVFGLVAIGAVAFGLSATSDADEARSEATDWRRTAQAAEVELQAAEDDLSEANAQIDEMVAASVLSEEATATAVSDAESANARAAAAAAETQVCADAAGNWFEQAIRLGQVLEAVAAGENTKVETLFDEIEAASDEAVENIEKCDGFAAIKVEG